MNKKKTDFNYLVNGPPPNVLAVTVPVLYMDAWDIKSVGCKKIIRNNFALVKSTLTY